MPTIEENEIVDRILGAARTATVTTRSGHDLHSRPLGVVQDEFDGKLWFFTQDPSAKTADVADHPEVNVAMGDAKGWLSFSGRASITKDVGLIDKFWNPWAEAHFEGGQHDPTVALLEVEVQSIEYWDIDRPAVARAVELACALATKKAPDVGESGTIDL